MKKAKVLMCLFLLAGVAFLISSCGGAAGTAPPYGSSSTSIAGRVTDADVDGATVNLYYSGSSTPIATTTSESDGDYSFSGVNMAQFGSSDMLYVIAEGGTVNGSVVSFLKFKSILGTGDELSTAAADGTLDTSDIPDLTVSNVTTAKVALVEKIRNIDVDPTSNGLAADVANIIQAEEDQEDENMGLVVSLAGMIKAAVDNSTNTAYTDSFTTGQDIADYVKNSITVGTSGSITVDMDDDLETAGAALEAEILSDEDLVKSAAGSSGTEEEATASDVSGTWYGYHVDTWGAEENMHGPGLVTATLATTGGTCTSGQVYMVIDDEVDETASATTRVSGVSTTTNTNTACGTIVGGNILNFGWTEQDGPEGQPATMEASGKIENGVINGTYSMKDSTGKAISGGIFKLGLDSSTDYSGTYEFEGSYTVLFLSDKAEQDGDMNEGDSSELEGSFTISGSDLSGSIEDVENGSGTADALVGELDGPRVKAKLSAGDNGDSTVFLIFLVGGEDITGIYMDFDQSLEDPDMDNVYTAGKFKLSGLSESSN